MPTKEYSPKSYSDRRTNRPSPVLIIAIYGDRLEPSDADSEGLVPNLAEEIVNIHNFEGLIKRLRES